MKQTFFNYTFTHAPKRLQKARMDNIAIVPASVLFYNKEYMGMANDLPTGSVLICTPKKVVFNKILKSVATFFQENGHTVRTLPISRFAMT